MMRRKDRFVRMVLTVGCCLFGLDLLAANAYLNYTKQDGHWSDPTIWANGAPPAQGDTARLYLNNDTHGGKVIVETEEDWAEFAKVGEAVLYYGAQLTLHTDTDRTITQTMGGGVNGTGSKIFKTGTGKLTMATQNFKGITVVSNGWMTMGPTSSENAGVYEVAEGATLEVYPNKNANTHLLGLRGAGTVTGSCGNQLAFCTSMYKGHDVEVMPPYHFSGTLTGSFGLTAGRQESTTCRTEGQYFDNLDTSTLTSDLRIYNGIFNVKSVGTKTKSDPSSIGNLTLNYFGTYNNEGDTFGFRSTADVPYATDKSFAISYSAGKAGRFPIFDGGLNGGITFTGQWDIASPYAATEATCFILDGSNTVNACIIDGEIVERLTIGSSASSASGHVFLKRGPGIWKLTSRLPHSNRGPILVERGRLEYESLAEAGEACSLGLMTRWTTNFWLNADCPAVGFAYLLGNGDNTVSPETATMAYVGESAASCSTRPLALKGAGRFANDGDAAMTYVGATAAEAGKDATLVLAGSNGGTFINVTNGVGRLGIVKEGTGTWTLGGNLALANGIDVREGTVRLMSLENRWFRLNVKELWSDSSIYLNLERLAMWDKDGNLQALNLVHSRDDDGPTKCLGIDEGEMAMMRSGWSRDWGDERVFKNLFIDDDSICCNHYSGTVCKYGDPDTWMRLVFRLNSTDNPVTKYDIRSCNGKNADGSPYVREMKSWSLEGSPDGRTWVELHSVSTNPTPASAHSWYSDNAASAKTPTGYELAVTNAYAMKVDASKVRVDRDATLDANGRTLEISELELNAAAGGGTITGAAIAAAGTIDVTDFERTDFDTEIPFDLTGCTGSANVADWTLKINGKPAKNAFRVTTTGVTVLKSGTMLIVR